MRELRDKGIRRHGVRGGLKKHDLTGNYFSHLEDAQGMDDLCRFFGGEPCWMINRVECEGLHNRAQEGIVRSKRRGAVKMEATHFKHWTQHLH